ncbi:hydroxyproline dehydrogenase-like [Ciona intestinalis]
MHSVSKLPLGRFARCVLTHPNVTRQPTVFVPCHNTANDVTATDIEAYNEPGFRDTPTKQLVRAAVVLRLSSLDFLVKHADTLFKLGNGVMGKTLFGKVMSATFYGQFCPGSKYEDVKIAAVAMQEAGVIPFFSIPAEEESKVLTNGDVEKWYADNTQTIIDCIDMTSKVNINGSPKLCHIKVTAIMDQALCKVLSDAIIANNGDDNAILESLKSFDKKPVHLDFLSEAENEHLTESLLRYDRICSHAAKQDVSVYIDAEYISFNPAIYLTCKAMMLRHNKTKPVVQITIQAYLKKAKMEIEKFRKCCQDSDIVFGAKIVRGAYMVTEQQRALDEGYEDPICDGLDATHANYNGIVKNLLRAISRKEKVHLMVASHNEDSVTHVVRRMKKLGIESNEGKVVFAQLYGLSDHVSNWLGENGYLIYKSTPLGTIEDTMPYLYRRAQENNSITKGDKRDRTLINIELSKRLRQFVFFWRKDEHTLQ